MQRFGFFAAPAFPVAGSAGTHEQRTAASDMGGGIANGPAGT